MKLSKQLRDIRAKCCGVCQLCGVTARRLVCDHCHVTETVRGFVCDECNLYLIPAGEHKPSHVSDAVRRYLSDPPLSSLAIRYTNTKTQERITCRLGDYREVWIGKTMIAKARIVVASHSPYRAQTHISLVSRTGNEAQPVEIEGYHGEEWLIEQVKQMRRGLTSGSYRPKL